jgi:hypothetical protein
MGLRKGKWSACLYAFDLAGKFRQSPETRPRAANLIAWILRSVVKIPALAYLVGVS